MIDQEMLVTTRMKKRPPFCWDGLLGWGFATAMLKNDSMPSDSFGMLVCIHVLTVVSTLYTNITYIVCCRYTAYTTTKIGLQLFNQRLNPFGLEIICMDFFHLENWCHAFGPTVALVVVSYHRWLRGFIMIVKPSKWPSHQPLSRNDQLIF